VKADYTRAMKRLSLVMVVVGIVLIVGVPFSFSIWPSGFRWGHPHGHPAYERMIVALYLSLGICLLLGARDPAKNVIIIDFTIISSILHGAVMAYDAVAQVHELAHLVGDVPLLFALAALFLWLHPRRLARRGYR
jgi:hydrogenase/urease accessory protein HupE